MNIRIIEQINIESLYIDLKPFSFFFCYFPSQRCVYKYKYFTIYTRISRICALNTFCFSKPIILLNWNRKKAFKHMLHEICYNSIVTTIYIMLYIYVQIVMYTVLTYMLCCVFTWEAGVCVLCVTSVDKKV